LSIFEIDIAVVFAGIAAVMCTTRKTCSAGIAQTFAENDADTWRTPRTQHSMQPCISGFRKPESGHGTLSPSKFDWFSNPDPDYNVQQL